ncbi:hypothetical protein HYFRA_00010846 [Hymenoscyphus fraxineus]|uniref:BRCT domain-containing protein n=1 Tax=Hymenoscyphus fraxineus TaxID=746836 RepID=A0A9N9PS75_9HELO|nr:hypothetical protein HYFRA_00010846 [Hymenoscyphus fraxineus]
MTVYVVIRRYCPKSAAHGFVTFKQFFRDVEAANSVAEAHIQTLWDESADRELAMKQTWHEMDGDKACYGVKMENLGDSWITTDMILVAVVEADLDEIEEYEDDIGISGVQSELSMSDEQDTLYRSRWLESEGRFTVLQGLLSQFKKQLEDANSGKRKADEDRDAIQRQAELYRKLWVTADDEKKTLQRFLQSKTKQVCDELIKERKQEETRSHYRERNHEMYGGKPTEATRGHLPADIVKHVRLPEKKCFSGVTLTYIGNPFPLNRAQLITFIEHYGGRFVSLGSADETTTYVIIGRNPYARSLDAISEYNIKMITQYELFDVVRGCMELDDVDKFLQEPWPKRHGVCAGMAPPSTAVDCPPSTQKFFDQYRFIG